MSDPNLSSDYIEHYRLHADTIRQRIEEFSIVRPSEYLYELLFCLLTPQSRAAHAEIVIAELRERDFLNTLFDPTPHLRDPEHYIRFHNQKGKRLLMVAAMAERIMDVLVGDRLTPADKREWLVANVNGLGWKEASHFLRNIGCRELAIIDRHILKHMLACGAIVTPPKSIGTRRIYMEMEERFQRLADSAGLSLQELDLLFWSYEEGSVRK